MYEAWELLANAMHDCQVVHGCRTVEDDQSLYIGKRYSLYHPNNNNKFSLYNNCKNIGAPLFLTTKNELKRKPFLIYHLFELYLFKSASKQLILLPLYKPRIRSINQFPLVLFLPCVYTHDCLGDIGHTSIPGPIHKNIYS